MTESQHLVNFAAHMRRIARKNDDEFRVTIEVDELGFLLEVEETSDWHMFHRARGKTIPELLKNAAKGIADSCEEWGYENCD